MVYALVYKIIGGGSILGPIFFALFVTCREEKNGFHCTNKACRKKMNAHRLPIPNLTVCWVGVQQTL